MTQLTTLNFDNPLGQAYWIMLVLFTVAPILFGLNLPAPALAEASPEMVGSRVQRAA